jgi:hypothetical protein
MSDRFLGFAMGVRPADVEAILRRRGVRAHVRKISPPAGLSLGLSRKRVLEKTTLRTSLFRRSVLVLMGLWGIFGGCLSFMVAAFWLTWSTDAQRTGLALSLATGTLAVVGTAIAVWRVRKEGPGASLVDSDLFEDAIGGIPWFGTGTELDLVVICILLVVLLFLFVLYVIWLPLLLGIVSLLTFGQLWREFRGALVVADIAQSRELGAAAEDLLQRDAVLSKSWDICLTPSAAEISARARVSHYRIHRLFLIVGASSLATMGLLFLQKQFPSDVWAYPIAFAIGGAILALIVLVFIEHQRRLATRVSR